MTATLATERALRDEAVDDRRGHGDDALERMRTVLRRQRGAFAKEMPVGLAVRKDRLRRACDLVVANKERFARALSNDFGQRSVMQTMLTDIMTTVKPLKYALENVERWMKPQKRRLDFPLGILGARAWVEYQPKGVVGIIAPWNFPVHLSFGPLAQVFAAGNRAMLKPSEFTPETSSLMAESIASSFDENELSAFLGDAAVGADFASLPFDHLIFTGATGVGREVLRAAAENLVPTTLELGGKSPVLVGAGADLVRTCERIVTGKLLNAGQICLAPDYLLVPERRLQEFVSGIERAVSVMYPKQVDNPDYTSIIHRRHRERLEALVEDARTLGATVLVVNPASEDFTNAGNKMPLHLVTHVNDTMRVAHEEIFGPVLPIVTYGPIEEAIDYIQRRPRPLALYYFGTEPAEERQVLDGTISGGVTVNDVMFHVVTEDLPFGGIGASGMGAYHGFEGFRTFSHAKSIYRQPRMDIADLAGFKPPYGEKTRKALRREIGE